MQFGWRSSAGTPVTGFLHTGMGRAMAIACHDLHGSRDSGFNLALGRALERAHIPLLRFDFAGHGMRRGEAAAPSYSQQMQEVDDLLSHLSRRGAQRFVLFGSGTGGSVAYLSAARDERIAAVASVGAVGRPAQLLQRPSFAQLCQAGPRLPPEFYRDSLAHDVVQAVRVLRAPILVLHGEADGLVPSSEAHDLACAARRASLELVLGGDHSLSQPQHLRPAVRRVASFLAEQVLLAMVQGQPTGR